MATINVQRNYNLTDAELCMFTSNLCNFLTRDLLDFASFGVTALKIAALKALGDAFEVLPTDGSLIGDVMITTENKNALREQVLTEIKALSVRVEVKWGISSGKYRRLDLRNPSQLSDDALLIVARTVHTKLTDYLPDLADMGLTHAMLDDFDDLIEDFENAKNAQADMVAIRDEKTLERINNGNEIYALVATYCNFGKILYEKTNPAKYNDYIIYVYTSPGSLTAPANFAFNSGSLIFNWDAVENATSYELESSTDDTNYSQYWSGSELTCTLSELPTTMMYYRVRARNAGGYGPFSDVIHYDFNPTLIAPSYLVIVPHLSEFRWGNVPTATRYEFQWKHTDQETWNPIDVGLVQTYVHLDPAGDYLARVRGFRNLEAGPFSEELSYTVPVPG